MNKSLGVICPVASLSSDYGIGDFGRASIDFIDFLKSTKVSIWQILPLNPTNIHNCPYGAMSSFAFDEMYVCPEELVSSYGLPTSELETLKQHASDTKINYTVIKNEKHRLLTLAYNKLQDKTFLQNFAKDYPHMYEYCYYKVLLEKFSAEDWRDTPKQLWKLHEAEAKEFVQENQDLIDKQLFFQFVLTSQWQKIKDYAEKNNIRIFGDMPIYLEPNAADVFAHPEIVQLDENYNPTVFGGCPPEDFSAEGQNWQSCVYDWEYLEKTNYAWLINRIKTLLSYYHLLKLDHFAGFVDHYEIVIADQTKNRWVQAGGEDFFDKLSKQINLADIVVENLGEARPECFVVKDKFNLKGMNVFQFAFGCENSKYLPHNVEENSIYYLGTHDNNTFVGFLEHALPYEKERINYLLESPLANNEEILIACINKMLESKADTIIVQIQDLLLQNSDSRINRPGEPDGCWEYRVPKDYKPVCLSTLDKLNI